jgi:hypothetical protein
VRSRLVVLAGALLLLALGIAVGAGPLQHGAAARERDLARQKTKVVDRDHRIEELLAANSLGSAYAGATAPRVVAGTLSARKVALVSLPGVESATVDQLAELVRSAGGEVTARVGLEPSLLAASGRGLLDALTSQMVTQTPGLSVPSDASAFERLGVLLARAIGVPASAHATAAAYDPTAISIISGLEAAKVIAKAEVTARAGLTLVVLPAATSSQTDPAAAAVLTSYVTQAPSVVAGPAGSARSHGLLTLLRANSGFTAGTVDSVETAVGRIIATLALAARTRGVQGDYGVVGTVDAAVPPAS